MVIGLDIGKYSVKMVQLSKNGEEITIENVGVLNTFDDLNKFNLDNLSKSQLSATIQDLATSLNIKPKKNKHIVSSLSGKSTDVRQITTLDMPDEELIVSLELEAKKHIPLDGTDAIIDYHLLGNDSSELDKINVILVTTTKNKVTDHLDIVKKSGFKAGIFDTDSIALSNLYKHTKPLPKEGADVILNIGHTSTTLIVWGEKSSFFTRDIEIAGHEINKRIMQELNLDYLSANNKKNELGINAFNQEDESSKEDGSISIEKRTVFNDLIEEIRKTLRFYMKSNNQSFFNTFYLFGGCANTPGLKDFISSNLNVKIEDFDPFQNLSNVDSIENPNQYAIAIGLALRGLEE